jgi:hypothetical protein
MLSVFLLHLTLGSRRWQLPQVTGLWVGDGYSTETVMEMGSGTG